MSRDLIIVALYVAIPVVILTMAFIAMLRKDQSEIVRTSRQEEREGRPRYKGAPELGRATPPEQAGRASQVTGNPAGT